MDTKQLLYRAEYARSGKARCKMCNKPISMNSLKLAVMVQSKNHDGQWPKWHHFTCFFGRARPKSTTDIDHFESLKWEDQEKIRDKIDEFSCGSSATTSGKGKKRANESANDVKDINDYVVNYNTSKKSKCKLCRKYILMNELRISKKDFESEAALQYRPYQRWHHVDCFLKAREELGFTASGSILPGFMSLKPEDQKIIETKIPAIKTTNANFNSDVADGASPAKKRKEIPDSTKELMKQQNEEMFFFKDNLKNLHKRELRSLLVHNKQEVPEGEANVLDRLSDIMTFGALAECTKCKQGQLVFRSGVGYQCTRHLSAWNRCGNIVDNPQRVPFQVPKEFQDSYSFMKKVKEETCDRIFEKALISQKPKPVLHGLKFMRHTTINRSAQDLMRQIERLGGQVISKQKLDEDVVAVVSNREEFEKKTMGKQLLWAQESDIHVISEYFFDEIKPTTSRAELAKLLDEKKISDWGSNASKKVSALDTVDTAKSTALSKFDKTVAKVSLKGGLTVDPGSHLESITHVYRKNDDIYSVVLSLTDTANNKNSYYKLQVLEGNTKQEYWLFRAWGRIGTNVGGTKVEKCNTLERCLLLFEQSFDEKTGNLWQGRRNFVKRPDLYMIYDVSYGDNENAPKSITAADVSESKLDKPVQNLMTLIFDFEQMKKAMLEFELDLNKMPLGILSETQIQKAFRVLNDLQNLINNNSDNSLIVEKTNQFYAYIPHNFGVSLPKLLNSEQDIKDKMNMLNDLTEIEIAYKMLQECSNSTGNPIDAHYDKLNVNISVLDPESDEYKFIQTYVKNTHAKTHSNYTLDIEHVFEVKRKEEKAKRFKRSSKLGNKKLLWHGSRLTNFAGILSQGLRIAPSEAPVTGYMFGKGLYFADMVSKSANYCCTSGVNNTGLVLLCEVALGEMQEFTKAHYVKNLPTGKHTLPKPYVVYNVAQARIKYLLQLKFNYKT